MKILTILVNLTDAELNQLEQNALARRDGPKGDQAAEILVALGEERGRRKENARLNEAAAIKRIREKVSHHSFEQRIEAAFTDLPPMEWERAALVALADRPGSTTEELSRALGYEGMYMNWFGHVCRDREPWLGPAVPDPDGNVIYSKMLIDFSEMADPATGRTVSQWRLKPDAETALKRLGIIR